MNPEEIRQVTAHDEKWVPTKERVKIGTSNVRLETTVPQKEETFQVIIDVIKNSTYYKAFTISAEVPEIFMQQFWHTVKKVTGTNSYEVQGEDIIEVLDDESTLTFLINLGYKGLLYKHPSMENVDYPELIWEDFAFQIDHRKENQRRRENMSYPRIGEDFLEYGLPIPETMMIEKIKQSESYQMFIKYSTVLIPPKKSRDVSLELGKSMSLTEAAEEEATRQVHATHERIVTESDPEPTRRRPSGITFRDTSSMSKKMSPASKKSIRSQPHAGGSSEGTGTKPGIPDESTITLTTSSEGTDSEYSEEDQGDDENIPWESTDEDEKKKDDDDDKCIDLKKSDDEETDDELVHSKKYVQDDDEETDDELVPGDEQVNEDEDEEMTNAEDADTGNSDEEIIDAEKAEEVKDEIKKAELPPSGFILSVSSGFGNQFLNLSSDTSLIGTIKDTIDAEINSLLDKDVQELKEVDNTTTLHALPRPEILPAVNEYLGSSLGDALQKSMQANVINEVKNQLPKFLPKAVSDFATPVIQSTVKKALEKTPLLLDQSSSQAQSSLKAAESLSEYELKTILFDKMDKSCSYLTHDKHQALFDALLNSMSLDDAIASGQADPEKIMRKKDRDDEDPSSGPNQGKKTKRSRTKESEPSQKSSTSKESSKGKSPAKTTKSGKSVITTINFRNIFK
ncbi:hypothetical protein Tco_0024908 [Tanacetum coccineum]